MECWWRLRGEGREKKSEAVMSHGAGTAGAREGASMYAEEGPAAAGRASPSCGVAFVTVNGFF